jgi:hypothetical protein
MLDNPERRWPGPDNRFPSARHPCESLTNPHCAGCDEYLLGYPGGWRCKNNCKLVDLPSELLQMSDNWIQRYLEQMPHPIWPKEVLIGPWASQEIVDHLFSTLTYCGA